MNLSLNTPYLPRVCNLDFTEIEHKRQSPPTAVKACRVVRRRVVRPTDPWASLVERLVAQTRNRNAEFAAAIARAGQLCRWDVSSLVRARVGRLAA